MKVGNLPGGEVPVALGGIVTREVTYRGSYRFVDEISDALRLMAEGVDVSPLMTYEVTHRRCPARLRAGRGPLHRSAWARDLGHRVFTCVTTRCHLGVGAQTGGVRMMGP